MAEFQMREEQPPPKERGGRPRGVKSDRDGARLLTKVILYCSVHARTWCAVQEYENQHSARSIATRWNKVARAEGFEFVANSVSTPAGERYRVYCRYTPPAAAPENGEIPRGPALHGFGVEAA